MRFCKTHTYFGDRLSTLTSSAKRSGSMLYQGSIMAPSACIVHWLIYQVLTGGVAGSADARIPMRAHSAEPPHASDRKALITPCLTEVQVALKVGRFKFELVGRRAHCRACTYNLERLSVQFTPADSRLERGKDCALLVWRWQRHCQHGDAAASPCASMMMRLHIPPGAHRL